MTALIDCKAALVDYGISLIAQHKNRVQGSMHINSIFKSRTRIMINFSERKQHRVAVYGNMCAIFSMAFQIARKKQLLTMADL